MSARVTLLSSEGLLAGLPAAIEAFGLDGPVALVSAGWQEFEGANEPLLAAVGRPVIDLRIYARAESVMRADEVLRAALRERQRRVQALQADYRVRLTHMAAAAALLPEGTGRSDRTVPEGTNRHRREALAALRALDRSHLEQLAALQSSPLPPGVEREESPGQALAQEREQVADALSKAAIVLIAGGHVAVLRNRIRLLGLDTELRHRNIIAWGAGAMVCSERIVLFLDHSPRGMREPEILDAGLGVVPRAVVMPGGRSRLALARRDRVSLIARRFAPSQCICLDGDATLGFEAGQLETVSGVCRLGSSGRTPRVRAS